MTFDTEVTTEVSDRIAEIGRSVVAPKRLTREECTTPVLRLEYIAQWLEREAPPANGVDAFNMLAIASKTDCGTACCIAGAACVWFGNSIYDFENSFDAARLLGLEGEDRRTMFFAARLDETVADLGKITPAWAARCIRKYQREGVVDWEGTR